LIYLQSAVNGLGIGSLYALVGLAAMFVLRVTGIVNFAVGAIVVLGGLFSSSLAGIPPVAVLVLTALVGVPVGVAVHFMSTRWLRGRSQFAGVLVTVAMASALQGLAYLLYSSDLRYAPRIFAPRSFQLSSSLTVDNGTLLLVAAVVVGYLACWLVLDHTTLGSALRAVSDDPVAARLVGLRVRRIEITAYAVFGALAFFVGNVYAQVDGVTADNVFPTLVGALFGLILGGSGNLLGPLIGGFLIGMAQSVTNARLSDFWGTVVDLLLVVVVLAAVPGGIVADRRQRSVA
jgi:branched-chain amino acid transport system permease protein